MNTYYFYNFKINSDIELPGCEENVDPSVEISKEIYIGSYINNSFKPILNEKNRRIREETEMFFEKEFLLLRYKRQFELCVFLTEDKILVDTECEDFLQTTSVLLGTGLSLFLLMRGYIPIHSGAFEYKGRAIAVSGQSGVGKSSFVRYALENGQPIITEDTLLLNSVDDLLVYPTIGIKSKLDDKTIKFFNIDSKHLGDKIKKTQKRWISIPSNKRWLKPIALDSLYFMEPDDRLSEVSVVRLNSSEKKSLLIKNINSLNDIPVFQTVKILKEVNRLSEKLDAYALKYPRTFDIFDALLETIKKQEDVKMNLTQEIIELIMTKVKDVSADKIGENTILTDDLGFDSLELVSLLIDLEAKYGIELDLEDLDIDSVNSVEGIVRLVSKYKVA